MGKRQETSVVDQLFNAIDNKNYSAARYTLCSAIEAEKTDTKVKPAREATPESEGQA